MPSPTPETPAPTASPTTATPTAAPTCTPTSQPTHEPFNCDAGLGNWTTKWSHEKKKYCCEHYDKGCQEEFDCWTWVDNVTEDWSKPQQDFCCEKHGQGCLTATGCNDCCGHPWMWTALLLMLVSCCCLAAIINLFGRIRKSEEYRAVVVTEPVLESARSTAHSTGTTDAPKEVICQLSLSWDQCLTGACCEERLAEEPGEVLPEEPVPDPVPVPVPDPPPAPVPEVNPMAAGEAVSVALRFVMNTPILENPDAFMQELRAVVARFQVLENKENFRLSVFLTTPLRTGHNPALMQSRNFLIKQYLIEAGLAEELIQMNPTKYHQPEHPRAIFQCITKEEASTLQVDTDDRGTRKEHLTRTFGTQEITDANFSFSGNTELFEDDVGALKEMQCLAEVVVHRREVLVFIIPTTQPETPEVRDLLERRSKSITSQMLRVGLKEERFRLEHAYHAETEKTRVRTEAPGLDQSWVLRSTGSTDAIVTSSIRLSMSKSNKKTNTQRTETTTTERERTEAATMSAELQASHGESRSSAMQASAEMDTTERGTF
eukprot:TRINITY_DN1416_c0_g1_i4.p1 TRINITY_DN1416_c0_g1~~TRINITY_DN1416_c0_g1_i4.p1  ORF type:complete len:546 (-),score=117.56 TRINITY_DN1416_c0_g1_i4:785-2422(-)